MPFKNVPDKLESPEFFMEIEGYDVRLAVQKINDFLETLGAATLSAIYSNNDEYENTSKFEKDVIRHLHIRHAIIDLNNCFDLLLQIPWFYYRAWKYFNPGEKLYIKSDKFYKNFIEIIRNIDGWVDEAEQACSYKKVLRFFENQTYQNQLTFKSSLENFMNTNIFNLNKSFTIRTISNQIKHKHSLKVKELHQPYEFNIKDSQGITVNARSAGIQVQYDAKFFDEDNPQTELGEIKVNYLDDLYIDIEFNSGELFRAKDYVKSDSLYNLDEIYDEIISYRDAIIDLYNELYNLIEPTLSYNPLLESTKFKKTPSLNLDKYFKQ